MQEIVGFKIYLPADFLSIVILFMLNQIVINVGVNTALPYLAYKLTT